VFLKVIQLVALCQTCIAVCSTLLQGHHIQKFLLPLNAGRHRSVFFLSYWMYSTPASLGVYSECPFHQNIATETLQEILYLPILWLVKVIRSRWLQQKSQHFRPA